MKPVLLRPSLRSLIPYATYLLGSLALVGVLYEASPAITMFLLWLIDMITRL